MILHLQQEEAGLAQVLYLPQILRTAVLPYFLIIAVGDSVQVQYSTVICNAFAPIGHRVTWSSVYATKNTTRNEKNIELQV